MGLWGSKQQEKRDVAIENSFITITDQAINNVLETHKSSEGQNVATGSAQSLAKPAQSSEPSLASQVYLYEQSLKDGLEKGAKEVEELFRNRYQTAPVCFDFKAKVHKCYQENKGQPLNCMDVSKDFFKCVDDERNSRQNLNKSLKA